MFDRFYLKVFLLKLFYPKELLEILFLNIINNFSKFLNIF